MAILFDSHPGLTPIGYTHAQLQMKIWPLEHWTFGQQLLVFIHLIKVFLFKFVDILLRHRCQNVQGCGVFEQYRGNGIQLLVARRNWGRWRGFLATEEQQCPFYGQTTSCAREGYVEEVCGQDNPLHRWVNRNFSIGYVNWDMCIWSARQWRSEFQIDLCPMASLILKLESMGTPAHAWLHYYIARVVETGTSVKIPTRLLFKSWAVTGIARVFCLLCNFFF